MSVYTLISLFQQIFLSVKKLPISPCVATVPPSVGVNVGGIVGGIVGGFVILCCILSCVCGCFVWIYKKRQYRKNSV